MAILKGKHGFRGVEWLKICSALFRQWSVRRSSVFVSIGMSLALGTHAQLNENCVVSVLNRTVPVKPDGTWVLPNVPANFGQVRARATCVENGITRSGQSDFFTVPANGAVNLPVIQLGAVARIPSSLPLLKKGTRTLPIAKGAARSARGFSYMTGFANVKLDVSNYAGATLPSGLTFEMRVFDVGDTIVDFFCPG